MTGFCDAEDVAEELPQFGAFTDSSRPALRLVELWIAESSADIRNAVASGGYTEIEEPLREGSAQQRWLRRANIDGALMRLGRYLYSFGPTSDAVVPWQSEFQERLSILRRGAIIFGPDDIAAQNRLL